MIKMFCDRCGNEITSVDTATCGFVSISSLKTSMDKNGEIQKVPQKNEYQFCKGCLAEFEKIFDNYKQKYGTEK